MAAAVSTRATKARAHAASRFGSLRTGLCSGSWGFVQEDPAKRRISWDCVECAVTPVTFSTAARNAGAFWLSANCLRASSSRCFWVADSFIARTYVCDYHEPRGFCPDARFFLCDIFWAASNKKSRSALLARLSRWRNLRSVRPSRPDPPVLDRLKRTSSRPPEVRIPAHRSCCSETDEPE